MKHKKDHIRLEKEFKDKLYKLQEKYINRIGFKKMELVLEESIKNLENIEETIENL